MCVAILKIGDVDSRFFFSSGERILGVLWFAACVGGRRVFRRKNKFSKGSSYNLVCICEISSRVFECFLARVRSCRFRKVKVETSFLMFFLMKMVIQSDSIRFLFNFPIVNGSFSRTWAAMCVEKCVK